MLYTYFWLYDNQDEYVSIEEDKLLLDEKEDSYYVPTQLGDINLSI